MILCLWGEKEVAGGIYGRCLVEKSREKSIDVVGCFGDSGISSRFTEEMRRWDIDLDSIKTNRKEGRKKERKWQEKEEGKKKK